MNHISLDDMRLFVAVVQSGSLTAAGELTGIPISRLSRRLTELETGLGTQLLNRGKKGVSLNELGEQFFRHAQAMLSHAEMAVSSVSHGLDKPSGLLKISVPTDISYAYLLPNLYDYLQRYPDVNVEMILSQQKINMIQDGVDVAIRAGAIENENVVARTLTQLEFGIYAHRSYLEKYGRPQTPNELYQHRVIAQSLTLPWRFLFKERSVKIAPTAYVACNDFTLVQRLIVQGAGIGLLTRQEAEKCPELEPLLSEWQLPPSPVSVLYYKNRGATPAVRSFVEWLCRQF